MKKSRDPSFRPRPLQIEADRQVRLQVPAIVRRSIGVRAGTKFNLFITEEGDLYFSKVEQK